MLCLPVKMVIDAPGACVRQIARLSFRSLGGWHGQQGYALPWTIVVLMTGVLVVVPVISLLGTMFLGEGQIEDETQQYYAADAAIKAVIEDLERGADGLPNPPYIYTPPYVAFGDTIPSITLELKETQTLTTVRPIEYKMSGSINVVQGFNPAGSAVDLAEDDDTYYEITGTGDPPVAVWEATSEAITFPEVSFGEVLFIAESSKSYTKVELFVFNPNDPLHTEGGYSPIADVTEILDLASTEETITFVLEDADLDYLNTLATKMLKVKVKATRTGGFRLQSDKLVLSVTGIITSDTRYVNGEPAIITGTLNSGSGANLDADDTNHFTVNDAGHVVEFEVQSDPFIFTTIDDILVPYIVRSDHTGVTIELYVYNPTDPSHTSGGYDSAPDLTTTIAAANLDKAVSMAVAGADVSYINSLPQAERVLKLKVRATSSSVFNLISDRLVFLTSSIGAPGQVVQQITQQYVDPGLKNPAMASIASKEGYLLRLYNVRSGIISVNWAYHTADYQQANTTVTIFRGLAIDNGVAVTPGKITSKIPSQGNEIVISVGNPARQNSVRTEFVSTETGVYSVMFYNDSSRTVITEPFIASGDAVDTWIYAAAYKDYVVTARVEDVQIKAVLRQIPGPSEPPGFPWSSTNINWIKNSVTILSWETGVESGP